MKTTILFWITLIILMFFVWNSLDINFKNLRERQNNLEKQISAQNIKQDIIDAQIYQNTNDLLDIQKKVFNEEIEKWYKILNDAWIFYPIFERYNLNPCYSIGDNVYYMVIIETKIIERVNDCNL